METFNIVNKIRFIMARIVLVIFSALIAYMSLYGPSNEILWLVSIAALIYVVLVCAPTYFRKS